MSLRPFPRRRLSFFGEANLLAELPPSIKYLVASRMISTRRVERGRVVFDQPQNHGKPGTRAVCSKSCRNIGHGVFASGPSPGTLWR